MYKPKPLPMKLRLLAIATIFVLNLNAQDSTFTFSLKQAQDYAVENSYINRQAEKDVEKSEKQVNETIGTGPQHLVVQMMNLLKYFLVQNNKWEQQLM